MLVKQMIQKNSQGGTDAHSPVGFYNLGIQVGDFFAVALNVIRYYVDVNVDDGDDGDGAGDDDWSGAKKRK